MWVGVSGEVLEELAFFSLFKQLLSILMECSNLRVIVVLIIKCVYAGQWLVDWSESGWWSGSG